MERVYFPSKLKGCDGLSIRDCVSLKLFDCMSITQEQEQQFCRWMSKQPRTLSRVSRIFLTPP